MKRRWYLYLFAVFIFASCSNSNSGELVGARPHEKPFYQPHPYGMVFIPQGSFTMGAGAEDITHGHLIQPKTVSVGAFYMDQTEITNDEYRQFVDWVRDSIARTILGEVLPDDYLIEENPKTGETYNPPKLNWKTRIDWNSQNQDVRDALEQMYLPENERFFRHKEIDSRKLIYSYYWVDLHAAAMDNLRQRTQANRGNIRPPARSVYVHNETINVYPDTLVWIADFTYSFNDPMTEKYFSHPAYDHYPVVGVNWNQARAFSVWRTQLLNNALAKRKGGVILSEFRLPTEAEWEWAARGGNQLNPYPWGGPYTRNAKGCFLANFKPLRGNYIADGGLRTVIVGHYPPNGFNLYDMAGNVSEWTSSAYDPSSYNITWDMNPDYTYNAKKSDPPAMKRKVIRGGSWKDIAYYLRVTTRAYEYQDTAKSYIGFRNVQSYLGRNEGDRANRASRVYR